MKRRYFGFNFAAWRRPVRYPWVGAALLLLTCGPLAAQLPSPELLAELRQRLTEAPDCQPDCAALTQLQVDADAGSLRLSLDLHAQAATAVPLPLPARAARLQPRRVELNGEPAPLYRDHGRDGLLWLRLPAGLHSLTVQLPLPPGVNSVALPLPLAPGKTRLSLDGWLAEGVYDGVASGQLQLTRLQTDGAATDDAAVDGAAANLITPFVRIERELQLGLDWQVVTLVSRLSQADTALVLRLPLLPGEQVTSAVRVENRQVLLNLPPGEQSFSWRSTLRVSDRLQLSAAQSDDYVEVWRLSAAPIWHIDSAGDPPLIRRFSDGVWAPEWRPWPGEQLTLTVSRPAGVAGQTVTIDSARLELSPGARASEASLSAAIRASQGVDHPLTLPADAVLTAVTVNGVSQPLQQDGRTVTLPLTPGSQAVALNWHSPAGIETRYRTPAFSLGAASVNNVISVNLPLSRWTLWVSGPDLGPAVLFWGLLLVIALAALALARYAATPLGTVSWFLLGVGLSQMHVLTALPVIAWLVLLGRRRAWAETGLLDQPWKFNVLQAALALLTLLALITMIAAIERGLLGSPSMQIAGNGSGPYQLNWYQDRVDGEPAAFPRALVLSVPLLVYRLLMLAWALWLAAALLRWLAWGWECFSSGGVWRRLRLRRRAVSPPS